MAKIEITCRSCQTMHTVPRTNEIPTNVHALECNWCPECEDDALEPYQEYFLEQTINKPTPVDPAQIKLSL